jgi:cell division protein FtsB
MRTHAERAAATQQFERMSSEVNNLRNGNAALASEVGRLRSDPRAIEAAARERLKMVRSNEIIVPIQ